MESKSLMIGDWIKVNDCENLFPLQVAEIKRNEGEYSAELYNEDKSVHLRCVCERLVPIHLTREILEKNGFEMFLYDGWTHSYKTKCPTSIYPFIVHGMMDAWGSHEEGFAISIQDGCNMNIDYVHELQHALRLCRLDELADNFKVQ